MIIAVAVSGGVDSLYALASLCKQGHEVLALHARFKPVDPNNDPVPGLEKACHTLGINLHVKDLTQAFEATVVTPFVQAYAKGETPNPCALCNATMKFGALMDAALALGAQHLATGHYASLVQHPDYGLALGQAADQHKDQSYFLSLVPAERLHKALFPLATLHKDAIRTAVAAQGLAVPLPSESQEICFVPHDDYRVFVQAHLTRLTGCPLPGPGCVEMVATKTLGLGETLSSGKPLEPEKTTPQVIGHHNGLWQYTEGQRRGLGIAFTEPLYVIGKDTTRNVLLTGPREALMHQSCTAHSVNLLVPYALWPRNLLVRTRYRQQASPAEVRFENERLHIRFHSPQMIAAPGQVAAIFDEQGHVLAGGLLREVR